MAILDPTTQYIIGTLLLVFVLAFVLCQPTTLVRWLRKKNYQYEVTFALYMLTPTEKFIFNSILFLTTSMLALACFVYLPAHLSTITRRAYYYFAGDVALLDATRTAAESFVSGTASKASEAVIDAASEFARAAYNTAAVAQSAVSHAAESLGWVT